LRDKADEANDPDRLAAICWTCDQQKTPRDLREIARTKRLAEAHQSFLERQLSKVPGRRVPSRQQWTRMQQSLINTRGTAPSAQPASDQCCDTDRQEDQ
jgi:hypothetical protein